MGGYNPLSWDSTNNYHINPTDTGRAALLFDLTNTRVLRQLLTTQPNGAAGQYQTYNATTYGPTFGGGHDLYINSSLSSGYTLAHSYGNGYGGQNLVGGTNYNSTDYGTIEVFTVCIAPAGTLSAALDGSGNLTINDTDGTKNNNLTVTVNSGNLVITDAAENSSNTGT